MQAWLGLGSNQQNPAARLREALDNWAGWMDQDNVTSSFYRTPPWGDEEQEDFINAVASIETSLAPAVLLGEMQAIEYDGSQEARRWGPRVIDIDLLLYGMSCSLGWPGSPASAHARAGFCVRSAG